MESINRDRAELRADLATSSRPFPPILSYPPRSIDSPICRPSDLHPGGRGLCMHVLNDASRRLAGYARISLFQKRGFLSFRSTNHRRSILSSDFFIRSFTNNTREERNLIRPEGGYAF